MLDFKEIFESVEMFMVSDKYSIEEKREFLLYLMSFYDPS